MHATARLAAPQRFASVEVFKQRWQVLYDVRQLHLDAMHERVAVEAIPLKSVELAGWTLPFDHEADAAGFGSLR